MAKGRGRQTPQEVEAKNYFSNKLNELLKSRNKKQIDLHRDLGIPKTTISSYVKGVSLPNAGNLQKIADYFGLKKSDLDPRFKSDFSNKQSQPYYALTPKDERDIAKELEEMIAELSNNGGSLAFSKDDEEFDEETRELLIASLEQSLRIAKMEAKKRFTPKKYRN